MRTENPGRGCWDVDREVGSDFKRTDTNIACENQANGELYKALTAHSQVGLPILLLSGDNPPTAHSQAARNKKIDDSLQTATAEPPPRADRAKTTTNIDPDWRTLTHIPDAALIPEGRNPGASLPPGIDVKHAVTAPGSDTITNGGKLTAPPEAAQRKAKGDSNRNPGDYSGASQAAEPSWTKRLFDGVNDIVQTVQTEQARQAIKGLQSDDETKRKASKTAINELVTVAVPLLCKDLASGGFRTRMEAREMLKELGLKAVKPLLALVDTTNDLESFLWANRILDQIVKDHNLREVRDDKGRSCRLYDKDGKCTQWTNRNTKFSVDYTEDGSRRINVRSTLEQ